MIRQIAPVLLLIGAIACGGCDRSTAVAEAQFEEPAPSFRPARFPIKVAPGGRYLIDSSGAPFLLHGDTAWALAAQLRRRDMERYLSDRAARGYNTVLVNLIEHEYADVPPANAYGERPFGWRGDFSKFNRRYFEHARYMVKAALERGILVLLTPAYMGYAGTSEGWEREMKKAGPAVLREYGRFLGKTFGEFPNVIWVQGGDQNPTDPRLARAIAQGIRDFAPHMLHTFHSKRHSSALSVLGDAEEWLSINTAYSDEHTVPERVRAEYQRSTMPFFLIEARYEGSRGAGAHTVRRQAYQAMLNGACGQIIGNNPLWFFRTKWNFRSEWVEQLNSPGATSASQIRALFESIEWWRLRPDLAGDLVTDVTAEKPDQIAAAIAEDRRLAVIYFPNTTRFGLNLSTLSGTPWHGRWFDPVSGEYRDLDEAAVAAAGAGSAVTPGRNSAGDEDWILVLRAAQH